MPVWTEISESGYEDTLSFLRQMEVQSFLSRCTLNGQVTDSPDDSPVRIAFFAETKEGAYPALKHCAHRFFPRHFAKTGQITGPLWKHSWQRLCATGRDQKFPEKQRTAGPEENPRNFKTSSGTRHLQIRKPRSRLEGRMLIPVPAANKKRSKATYATNRQAEKLSLLSRRGR